MSMKPGCVVFNPAGNSWCVLVETRKDNGEIRRFMSFHSTYENARAIEEAHTESNAGDPNVTVSVFEYDYIANEIELASMLIAQAVDDILSRAEIDED